MKHLSFVTTILLIVNFNSIQSQELIFDHTCLEISQIPMNWIDSAQAKQKWHYAHTSHGGQLTTGLDRIETNDPDYNIDRAYGSLPIVPNALCICDGQEGDSYVTPEDYWRTTAGMNKTRDVLNNNPTINISQWSWCTQPNYYSENDIENYLDSISILETEFPDVTFIYMTGNAQTGPGNHYNQNLDEGYNRFLRNEQIRNYCIDNNKVLFDFADIDCWWYNPTIEEWEYSNYEYWNGSEMVTVPFEHPQYNVNQAGHTSYENCEHKAMAVWWMMAKLAGWDNGIRVNLKVYLEGPFNGTAMNTNLDYQGLLPLEQPYNMAPWNYSGTEEVISTFPDNTVDWILLQVRDTTDVSLAIPASIKEQQAVFLLSDGSVVDINGLNPKFGNPIKNQCYIAILHRNHLGIISATPLVGSGGIYSYDFSTGESQAYGGILGHKELGGGSWGMVSGDCDADGNIHLNDKLNIWESQSGKRGYLSGDLNLDGQTDNKDKNEKILNNIGRFTQIPN